MKNIIFAFTLFLSSSLVLASDTVFDSMDKAIEVKLAPAINTTTNNATTNVNSTYRSITIKEQKFNNALNNLDDAQVELRQELSSITTKYNIALEEKERATETCKALKQEIKAINKKMKNIDKSKKIINSNLESEK